jgi:amino acid transporter
MAKDGNAPKIFTICNKRGVPYIAFAFTACFMGLAYLVASSDALTVFDYFTSSVTVFGSLTWISILASHVGFMRGMKAQGLSRDTLPYKAVSIICPEEKIRALLMNVSHSSLTSPTLLYSSLVS